jgi:hypothetical protein
MKPQLRKSIASPKLATCLCVLAFSVLLTCLMAIDKRDMTDSSIYAMAWVLLPASNGVAAYHSGWSYLYSVITILPPVILFVVQVATNSGNEGLWVIPAVGFIFVPILCGVAGFTASQLKR